MADVVGQRQRLGQFLVQPQRAGQCARDLRDFQSVGEAAAEVVRRRIGRQARKHLRLAGQAAKGARMQNAGPSRAKGVR